MPGVGTEKPDNLIANGGVGSILWQMDVKEINRLQHIAMRNPVCIFPSSSVRCYSWIPHGLPRSAGGKLPVSWPRTAGSEPLYYNHPLTHEPEDAPRFTSRYWDINSKPLYAFGFGLSYSTFKFANLQLSKTSIGVGDTTEISVDVTNTGSVAGDAVAQIYIHQRYGSASRPVRQLKGFERIALQPGETKTLKFPL